MDRNRVAISIGIDWRFAPEYAVDLDYAFRSARKERLIAEDNEDIQNCREILADIAAAGECNLDNNGWPTKGGELSPSEAYAKLAEHPEARNRIKALHTKLLAKDIWLWKYGALENHLRLKSKSEQGWVTFLEDIQSTGFDSIPDKEGILDFLKWIDK